MPAVHSKASEEQLEFIDEELVRKGRFENRSEAIQYLIQFSLDVKYGFEE